MWTSILHHLAMGGYAIYVWPAYGLFLAALIICWGMNRRRFKALMKEIMNENNPLEKKHEASS